MFNINFIYLLLISLPTRLRNSRMVAYMRVALSWLQQIYNAFVSFRSLMLYDINFTGQTMYLEKKLRDTFGCNGIEITDGTLTVPNYLYNNADAQLPLYLYNESENQPLYLYHNAELSSQNDFIVKIPSACYSGMTDFESIQMRTIIEFYKLAQKTYTIISV